MGAADSASAPRVVTPLQKRKAQPTQPAEPRLTSKEIEMTNQILLRDPRLDVLRRAVTLIRQGDTAGEGLAHTVASHLCWEGAVAYFTGEGDPMEPGELRDLLDEAVTATDLLSFSAWDVVDLFAVEGWPCTPAGMDGWRAGQRDRLDAALAGILVLQGRAEARAVEHYGLIGYYARPQLADAR